MAGKYVIRYSDKGPVFVTTVQGEAPVVTLANGQKIVGVRADKYGGTFANGGESDTGGKTQYQWVLPGLPPGGQFIVTHGGATSAPISITATQEVRSDNGGLAGLKAAPNKAARGGGAGLPGAGAFPGSFGPGVDGNGNVIPGGVDPSGLNFGATTAGVSTFPEGYKFTDPTEYTQKVGALNRQQSLINLDQGKQEASQLIDFEKGAVADYSSFAQTLQQNLAEKENKVNQGFISNSNQYNQGEVSNANQFNQGQLNASYDRAGLPVKQIQDEQIARARSLARGQLPLTIEDQAFEAAARSSALDGASAKGYGESGFARTAIDKFTIGERLNLMKQGSDQLDRSIQNAVKLLVDAPIKYQPLTQTPSTVNVASQIKGGPSVSPIGLGQSQQNNLTANTTLSPQNSLQSTTSQISDIGKAQIANNQYNVTTQLQNDQFNTTGIYSNDLNKLNITQNNINNANQTVKNAIDQIKAAQESNKKTANFNAGINSGDRTNTKVGINDNTTF